MSTWKTVFGICGFVLALAGVVVFLIPDFIPAPVIRDFERHNGTAEVAGTYQLYTAGPEIYDSIAIMVHYPMCIRKNETLYVEVRASQSRIVANTATSQLELPLSTDDPLTYSGPLEALAWPISLELSGAAFDIDPKERSFPQGSPLPIDVTWTALPKSTGVHKVVVDWSHIAPAERGRYIVRSRGADPEFSSFPIQRSLVDALILSPDEPGLVDWFLRGLTDVDCPDFADLRSPWVWSEAESGWLDTRAVRVSVNGQPVLGSSNLVSLPVKVLTKFGITQFWQDVLTILASLIGFLLGLPMLLDWFSARLSRRSMP